MHLFAVVDGLVYKRTSISYFPVDAKFHKNVPNTGSETSKHPSFYFQNNEVFTLLDELDKTSGA